MIATNLRTKTLKNEEKNNFHHHPLDSDTVLSLSSLPCVPAYRLYWLRCLTEGKEEQPFLIDAEGKQRFVYGDVIDNIKGY